LGTGGEGEVTGADGFLEEEFFKGGRGLEHGGMMGWECKWWKAEKAVQDFSRFMGRRDGRADRSPERLLLLASGSEPRIVSAR
jgi:hypothetical protein